MTWDRHGGVILLLLGTLLLNSCATQVRARRPLPDVGYLFEEPETRPEYRLSFGDVIEVKVFNHEQFNDTVAMRPDGRITLQRIGDIFAIGMTPSALDSLITAHYARFIRDPDLTVFVREFGRYQYYVFGEVNTAGGFKLESDITVLQALANAGGPKDGAQMRSVFVLRRKEGRKLDVLRFDLGRIAGDRRWMTVNPTFFVQPQDVIYVPKSFIASVGSFLDQVYRGVLPPVEAYLRALWWTSR